MNAYRMIYCRAMSKRAILSVHDKSGLIELATALERMGWELIASGGTARTISQTGLTVRDVAALTGAPEMLGGRVKTLHPAVHGGILARHTAEDLAELAALDYAPIDLVVCNLYPFEATIAQPGVQPAEAIEQIDIGGVTLLRAAAKNHAHAGVVCDPDDYAAVIEALEIGELPEALRRDLAIKAFQLTQSYDTAIAGYLSSLARPPDPMTALPPRMDLALARTQVLRYGENPHQSAALYARLPNAGPLGGALLGGKALSYSNLLDLDSAWRAAESFDDPVVVIVKHLSPCGIAVGRSLAGAFPAALASDPVSAFGGVIAVNRTVDADLVAALDAAELFVEAIAAPGFSAGALDSLRASRKNLRLVAIGDEPSPDPRLEMRSVRGGVLVQSQDTGDAQDVHWSVVSARPPSDNELAALRFAWLAVQHVKSNAIVLARESATVGIGGGLPSRVDATRLATAKAGKRAAGAVMASDAFFPFPDAIEVAAEAGVTAVVQPGGSIRDAAVIAAADSTGLVLVHTGMRHFRH